MIIIIFERSRLGSGAFLGGHVVLLPSFFGAAMTGHERSLAPSLSCHRGVCYLFNIPLNICGPKGHGSGGAAADATAVAFYMTIFSTTTD